MTNIHSPVSEIPFAKRFEKNLKRLGIHTVKDLLWHFPRRYEDFSEIKDIADLKEGEEATVKGEITDFDIRRSWKKKFTIIEIVVSDETESIKAVWFNQPYLKNSLKIGKTIYLAGEVSKYKGELTFSHPIHELSKSNDSTTHTARIIPIYPETKGLTSRGIRYLMEKALEEFERVPDIIPESVRKKSKIPEVNKALHQIHFPENKKEIQSAKKRFAFEDLFLLQLSNFKKRWSLSKKNGPEIKTNKESINRIKNYLPFDLTGDQEKSLNEITKDLKSGHPMTRLLQGDVGSGKTIVAAIAAILTAESSFQTALMAPTEILARQHYETFKKIFEEFGEGIALLTKDESQIFFGEGLEHITDKKSLTEKIGKNTVKIVIGTHALIQKNVSFKKLGLTIIDEQHRFGVKQRAKLTKSKKTTPHLLSMTATPIPRTLAITAFGDLDISTISELPKNRKPIKTKIVPPKNRKKAYQFIKQEVKEGRQVFVICPRIEQGEETDSKDKRKNIWNDVKAVKEEYEKLNQKIFPNLEVEMVHGKLKSEEKEEVMKNFTKGKSDILVSTSVVEVGIDIPNATIMMVEGAERFGLAQLYQFKGRVGRGKHQSYCLLFSDPSSPETRERLKSVVESKNGFELAQKDLELRGPGEFLGKNQAGMPDNAMKTLQNPKLVSESREIAEETIKKDPELEKHPELKKRVEALESKMHRE